MTRISIAFVVALFLSAVTAAAQQETGEIIGRAMDGTGAVLPGVTVTISGPALLQPRVGVTGETGRYQFPRVPIGTYRIRFELAGFRAQVHEDIRITIGFTAEVNATLELSALEETITLSGRSPVVDTRRTTTATTLTQEQLQGIPSARDPWVMLDRAPGIAMDRVNVGGNESGDQSAYISRGATPGNNKWAIDGVDITDMSATGASPFYYDFDMIEEMQVTTGGADASQQTGGVGINFVTRSGTDVFRGSGRVYVTDDRFQADNVDDAVRAAGAGSGAPIQNIKDYGIEAGGPLRTGRLWLWGSVGGQEIETGTVGFYLKTPPCTPPPPSEDVAATRKCLATDDTQLTNLNWKLQWQVTGGNKLSVHNLWANKTKSARGASDTRPLETTWRQSATSSKYATYGWTVGPSPLWKVGDQHIVSDRWLVDVQLSHLGNNFILDLHDESLNDVQAVYEISTRVWGRSYSRSGPYIRPTYSVDIGTDYFLPDALGGDHAFKAGYRWRAAKQHAELHWGGNAVARYRYGAPAEADLYRDSITDFALDTHAFFLQDAFTRDRLTVNVGVRWDRQANKALRSEVPENPLVPQWLPAVTFDGADAGVVYTDVSPRLGLTYDVGGDGRIVLKASYAIYYGQHSPGEGVSSLNPVTVAWIRFPWNDVDGDAFVQPSELDQTRILAYGGNYDPDAPSYLGTSGSVDPDVKNDRTREFIVGLDQEIARGMAIGVSYIRRKYDRFWWQDRLDFSSADYEAVTYTPPSSSCLPGARCETVTYYQPTIPMPAAYVFTNQPDRHRDYNGVELTFRKRYSNRWMAAASYAYNSAVDYWESPDAYEDPTNIENLNAAQFAPTGVNGAVNARWLVKATGMYTLPWWDVSVSGVYSVRQGFPFPQAVRTPSRANRAGTIDVLLDPMGTVRLGALQTLDLRIEKAFSLGRVRISPAMDVFNVGNVNTALVRHWSQNASNANNISQIVAPRIIRFGVRASW